MNQRDIFYQALLARDHRFDGKFFVGVKTTGIYCRPICPAKPKKENVEFYSNHHEAERAGYRPCLRCRPESAPMSPAWIGKSAVIQRASKILHTQETLEFNEDKFAALFGVSARHLRRLFQDEVGKTPKQIAFENRLNLARKLIIETRLSITDVAFAAGFSSIRRFNDSFKDRFKKTPREIRRNKVSDVDGLKISLPYRPPFDFDGLYLNYQKHQIGLLERFDDGKIIRIVALNGKVGQITISNNAEKSQLEILIDFPDTSMIYSIISKVRHWFDLDSDPVIIANSLEADPEIGKLWKRNPGIRMPSGWDGFEIAVLTILGQLVSVEQAQSLAYDLIELLGKDSGLEYQGRSIKLFPTPKQLATANLDRLKTTNQRKQTLTAFAKAVADKTISLESTQNVDEFLKKVLAIKGIGPWTASYMALKVLRHTDSFPDTDLILARALELHPKSIVQAMSPWRGYVAALFWRNYSHALKKTGKKGKNKDV
jgi:AraC family transcriptional regulator, regulatory protein of adaptative response / DNA-3-methyladenine glycosylase II